MTMQDVRHRQGSRHRVAALTETLRHLIRMIRRLYPTKTKTNTNIKTHTETEAEAESPKL